MFSNPILNFQTDLPSKYGPTMMSLCLCDSLAKRSHFSASPIDHGALVMPTYNVCGCHKAERKEDIVGGRTFSVEIHYKVFSGSNRQRRRSGVCGSFVWVAWLLTMKIISTHTASGSSTCHAAILVNQFHL